jgi:hypothetical protein
MRAYMNDSITHETPGTPDEYNEVTYSSSTIKGRIEPGYDLVRTAQGEEVVSTATLFTETAVSENDKIDGHLVVSVIHEKNLDGSVEFYEAKLK